MKCLILIAAAAVTVGLLTQQSALALPAFKPVFEERYSKDNTNEEFKKSVKKAGCNICHVKGEKSKEVRNAYGDLLAKLIEGEAKDRIKTEKEKVLKEFEEAMTKAEEEKGPDGVPYGELFKSGKLPPSEKAKKE
ncbi:MAG: hypothetical protein O2931_06295 [Planctomycetota bacterium]|nr:hypothetical protein [Planctomycetota bacterium]MDA1178391.1 hypothetical protein [Planctomycetota bacterium]